MARCIGLVVSDIAVDERSAPGGGESHVREPIGQTVSKCFGSGRIAMDGEEATIDVSNDVPYVTSTSTSDAGQITTQVARERIGIILTVTPQINDDG